VRLECAPIESQVMSPEKPQSCPGQLSEPATVVVVGPSPTLVGGVATAVRQIHSLDFGDRYRIEPFSATFSTDEREPRRRRAARHVSTMRRLAATIRRTRAVIVHLHTCSGFSFHRSIADMLLARRQGVRVILHIHGAAFDEFHARAGAVQRRVIAWALGRADTVVALSETWSKKLHEMAPSARLVVVENAVACPSAFPSPNRGDGPCRFLLLARMDVWKGIDDLLDACAVLRERGVAFELMLAGPPGTAGTVDVLGDKIDTRALGAKVHYVGALHGDQKTQALRRADVYVQPSHHEGMPISMLEALAHGLPILATSVGAVPEVMTHGREGMLVPAHSPDRLAAAMEALASDTARREAMASAAYELAAARFSLSRFRDDLLALYDRVRAAPAAVPHPFRVPVSRTPNTAIIDP